MWYGIIMTDEEINEKYYRIRNIFEGDKREKIPREELSRAIQNEFNISNEVAEAYITLGLTYYSTDWFTVLDNAVRLMKTKMVHDVYEVLEASGEEPTIENAKELVNEVKEIIIIDPNSEYQKLAGTLGYELISKEPDGSARYKIP